ncbi:MAG: hypothetical protein JWM87_2378 [Candidatus Eremiobacteraeota bacterium]|nr:hypothetical protein [Candidatus Eremiobacteraeota bacterium]
MRLLAGALFCVLGIAAFAATASRADAAFSDKLCPEATQYVIALGQVPPSDPPQRIYDAARATTAAYDSCAKRQLADAKIEPGVHYAYTREASFAILEARALVALNRPSDAKAVALNAKRLAQDVFDWRRSIDQNGAYIQSSGSDNRPSVYRDSAKEIIAAADDMLAKLAAVPATASAAPVPVPVSSPHR